MQKQSTKSKSPLTLLLLIAFLVISTLVVISNYFFRPGVELNLKNQIVASLYSHKIFNAVIKVEGRDVTLDGIAVDEFEVQKVEKAIQSISGINEFENNLEIHQQAE